MASFLLKIDRQVRCGVPSTIGQATGAGGCCPQKAKERDTNTCTEVCLVGIIFVARGVIRDNLDACGVTGWSSRGRARLADPARHWSSNRG